MVDTLHARNQFPVVALELEFYLIDKERGENGELQTAINPTKNKRERDTEVYDVDGLDDYADFLSELNAAAADQGLNTAGALAESAPGNSKSTSITLKTCFVFAMKSSSQNA